jgi:CcmD family protein
MVNVYLVLAYGFVWGIFMLYAWMIHGRQKRLEREVEELKRELGPQGCKDLKSQI